jgi:putative tricarboxylic transport membrane protein
VFDSALKAVADVETGNADAGVVSAVSAVKALASGALRAIAVSSPSRLGGMFASAPAWSELAVPCTIGQWRGFVGPPGMPPDAVAFWEQAFARATASAAWQAELEQNYWTATFKDGAETRAFLDEERAFLGGMLADLGLTPQGR